MFKIVPLFHDVYSSCQQIGTQEETELDRRDGASRAWQLT